MNLKPLLSAVATLFIASSVSAATTQPPQNKWTFGPAQTMGNGRCSSFVKTNSAGKPMAMGFMFSAKCLDGLPPVAYNASHAVELQMPPENPTGINHLEFDWNAKGHDPKPIYGVPHFDFHFYLCDDKMLDMVMGGPDKAPVATKYVPQDYISGVISVPHMGTHWIDKSTPELHGKPFTGTFIYGFYQGDMKFVEPMFALNFLKSKQPFHLNIKQPTAFQNHAWYPRQMQLEYNAKSDNYFLTLSDLVKH